MARCKKVFCTAKPSTWRSFSSKCEWFSSTTRLCHETSVSETARGYELWSVGMSAAHSHKGRQCYWNNVNCLKLKMSYTVTSLLIFVSGTGSSGTQFNEALGMSVDLFRKFLWIHWSLSQSQPQSQLTLCMFWCWLTAVKGVCPWIQQLAAHSFPSALLLIISLGTSTNKVTSPPPPPLRRDRALQSYKKQSVFVFKILFSAMYKKSKIERIAVIHIIKMFSLFAKHLYWYTCTRKKKKKKVCTHPVTFHPPHHLWHLIIWSIVHLELDKREEEEGHVDASSNPAVDCILLVFLLGVLQGVVVVLPVGQRDVLKQRWTAPPEKASK